MGEVRPPEPRAVHLALDGAEEVFEGRGRLDDDGRLFGCRVVHEDVHLELGEAPHGRLGHGERHGLLLLLLVLFLFLEDFQIGQDVLLDLVEVAVDLLVGVHVAKPQIRDLLHHGGGAVLVLEGCDLLPDLALDVPGFPHDRIELDAQVDDFRPDGREFLLAELVFLGHGLELLEGHGAPFHDRGDVLPGEGAHLELHELEILLQQAIVELPDDLLLLLPIGVDDFLGFLLELVALEDQRDLLPQVGDEVVHILLELSAAACREHDGPRHVGVLEIVDVADVVGDGFFEVKLAEQVLDRGRLSRARHPGDIDVVSRAFDLEPQRDGLDGPVLSDDTVGFIALLRRVKPQKVGVAGPSEQLNGHFLGSSHLCHDRPLFFAVQAGSLEI